MIIDAWLQHPTPDFVGHELFASIRRWVGIEEIPESIPLELTLGAMDAAGVDLGLLSAWTGPQGELIPNDTVADAVSRHPTRFVGIASVDLSRPMRAVAQVREAAAQGFKGVRILPWLWGLPPDDRRFYPVYVACCEEDLAFCTQVGHAGPLVPSEPGRPIPYLDTVAADFPELTIVGGHVGYPWTEEMVALARKYPRVFIDTSAYTCKRFPRTLVEYMGSARHKVLFGSNFPMLQPAACLADLDALALSAVSRERFLSGNAVEAFGLHGLLPTEAADGS